MTTTIGKSGTPCPEPPQLLLTGVASPCTPEHWNRVRVLIRELMSWIEEGTGIKLMDAQHDTRTEMDGLEEYYGWPNGQFLVGILDGKIVGTTGVRMMEPGVAELRRVYVAPEARGHGIAPMMLRSAIRVADQLGATRVRLETLPRLMDDAVRMYRRTGFTTIPSDTPGLSNHPDVLAMELSIGAAAQGLAKAG